MVCYKESDFHVKEICIGEGILDHETVSIHKDNNNDYDMNIDAHLDTAFVKYEWLRGSTLACCSMDVESSSSVPNAANSYDDDDINKHPLQVCTWF